MRVREPIHFARKGLSQKRRTHCRLKSGVAAPGDGRTPLFHSVKGFLKDLPIFQSFEFIHGRGVQGSLFGILGGPTDFKENSEITGESFAGELVGGGFVSDIVP